MDVVMGVLVVFGCPGRRGRGGLVMVVVLVSSGVHGTCIPVFGPVHWHHHFVARLSPSVGVHLNTPQRLDVMPVCHCKLLLRSSSKLRDFRKIPWRQAWQIWGAGAAFPRHEEVRSLNPKPKRDRVEAMNPEARNRKIGPPPIRSYVLKCCKISKAKSHPRSTSYKT